MNDAEFNALPKATLADITPEWMEATAEAGHKYGQAIRAGAGNTIEVQSENPPHAWHRRALSRNTSALAFETAADRDAVLTTLLHLINKFKAASVPTSSESAP